MQYHPSFPISAQNCPDSLYNSSTTKNGTENLFCGYSFDSITCWPPTPNNSYASHSCPFNLSGIIYNVYENATRYCESKGTWKEIANYENCLFKQKIYDVLVIWFVGYTISTIALWVALILLRYFRALRCLRNEIHCNLIVSFILRVFMWYLNLLPQMVTTNLSPVIANISAALLRFLSTANFFWMFVEGLYLFTIIVWTYGVERYNIWHYSIIGWGIPFLLTTIAVIAMSIKAGINTFWLDQNEIVQQIILILIHIPIFVSIIINVFVLAFIIYTLVIKMKETKRPIRRNSNRFTMFSIEYKKAIKAAVVLIPLLGISHCLGFFTPTIKQYGQVYRVCSALLSSTQGFFVALIYCFLNREVRFVLGARYRSFRGLLPNNRLTLDESVGPVRRSNSMFKVPNPTELNNVFQCRTQRPLNSNSDSTLENVSVIKDPLIA